MKVKLFSLRDSLTSEFSAPTPAVNVNVFVRLVGDAPAYRNHADDFDVFFLGDFDSETGLILPDTKAPKFIAHLGDSFPKSN